MRRAILVLLLMNFFVYQKGEARPPTPLSLNQLQKAKLKPCSLIHVWATWCSICLQEMPNVVSWLTKNPKINPIVLDVSKPFLQDQIAKKWKILIEAPFATYLKPEGPDRDYFRAIDEAYDNSLPFTALYDGGRRKAYWRGTLDLRVISKQVAKLCH